MKLAYEKMNTVMEIIPTHVTGLIIENAGFLYNFLNDLYKATEDIDCGMVVSENEQPIRLSKNVSAITDFIGFTTNQKSLLTKIVSELEKTACNGEFYEKTQRMLAYVENYVNELTFGYSCELSCEKLNVQSLLKGLGISLVDDYDSLEEKVLAYMDLAREFEGKKLFILYNLRCLIPADRLQLMINTAIEREHYLLIVDNMDYPILDNEKRIIVDSDLCEI